MAESEQAKVIRIVGGDPMDTVTISLYDQEYSCQMPANKFQVGDRVTGTFGANGLQSIALVDP